MADRPRSLKDVKGEIADRGIEFLFAQFVDMYAKPSAKLVPANHVDDLFAEGAGFAGFAAGEIGQGPHNPDMAAMPDPASFTPVPWQPNLARFACDVFVEGEPWPSPEYAANQMSITLALRAAASGAPTTRAAPGIPSSIRSLSLRSEPLPSRLQIPK